MDIDPLAAMTSPFVLHEVVHTSLSAYMTTAFAVAAIHAWALLPKRLAAAGGGRESFHRKALVLALAMAIPAALAQPLVGHFAGQQVARHQPLKLAAMESLEAHPGPAPRCTSARSAIPGALSFMAFNDFEAVVKGSGGVSARGPPPPHRPRCPSW